MQTIESESILSQTSFTNPEIYDDGIYSISFVSIPSFIELHAIIIVDSIESQMDFENPWILNQNSRSFIRVTAKQRTYKYIVKQRN